MESHIKKCQSCKEDFTIDSDDFLFYEKIGVVTPNICPSCRAQLRLSFRNERVFYKRACDRCHKDTISMYSPNKHYTVWCYDCWFSDEWDASEYAQTYDEGRDFFDQFNELHQKVPKVGLIYVRSPESSYTNISADNKNCYFIIESSNNENSIHSYWIQECRDVVDTSFGSRCELCYECDGCYNSYKLLYSKDCFDCRESYFLFDCRDCSDCVGCINLRNKKYCIFNEQYTQEEYTKKVKGFNLSTSTGVELFQKKFEFFKQTQPHRFAELTNTINATGNYIKNAKNCKHCFHCYDAEDNKYGVHIWRNAKDTMDSDTAGRNASHIYNSINAGIDTAHYICCAVCWSCTYMQYSMYCFNSNNCFGCVGLRKKNYSILNKQYSKDEYEKIVEIIISQMLRNNHYGEFFPKELSCFGYNESAAYEQFLLTEDQAKQQGFKWESIPRGTFGKETIKSSEVPDDIFEIILDIPREIFSCVNCNKNFRIIENEFSFYKRLQIPLPRLCPDCRHARRFKSRGPNKLWHRQCMCDLATHDHQTKCQNTFETSYHPERPEKIYCEPCYQKEVV